MCGVCDRIKETKDGNNPFLVKELENRVSPVLLL